MIDIKQQHHNSDLLSVFGLLLSSVYLSLYLSPSLSLSLIVCLPVSLSPTDWMAGHHYATSSYHHINRKWWCFVAITPEHSCSSLILVWPLLSKMESAQLSSSIVEFDSRSRAIIGNKLYWARSVGIIYGIVVIRCSCVALAATVAAVAERLRQ